MAAEIKHITNHEKKLNEQTRASIKTFESHREHGLANASLLKRLGGTGVLLGLGLLTAGKFFAGLVAYDLIQKAIAAGKVALAMGGTMLGVGFLKGLMHKHEKPA